MADERQSPASTITIAGIESATPSQNGQTLRISLMSADQQPLDLILPYDLAPGLQRLIAIVAEPRAASASRAATAR